MWVNGEVQSHGVLCVNGKINNMGGGKLDAGSGLYAGAVNLGSCVLPVTPDMVLRVACACT